MITTSALVTGKWSGIVLLLLIFFCRPLKMLVMKVVFKVYGVPHDKQVEWVLKEARKNDKLTFARNFWNRSSQRRPTINARLKRIPVPRREETATVVELPGEHRSPAA